MTRVLGLYFCGLLVSSMLLGVVIPGVLSAAPVCNETDRVLFAGHNLPLNTDPDPQPMRLVRAFPNLSFSGPVLVAASPDNTNRLFVVEQSGTIQVFENRDDVTSSSLFLDIRSLVEDGRNEQGLLGLAFDPDFATNRRFYVNFTASSGCAPGSGTAWCTKIVRFEASESDANAADPSTEELVFEFPQTFVNHNGGMLVFGPDDYLYVGVGDGGGSYDPLDSAQDLGSNLGSILRLDVRETAPSLFPADNPFVDQPEASGAIFHYGLRNPWRFSFDALTGDLWIGDVGQNQWEEIHFLPAGTPGGVNFGWDFCEGSQDAGSKDCSSISSVPPVIEYPHPTSSGASVTGGYVYRGTQFPELQGVYIYSDYISRVISAWDPGSGESPIAIGSSSQGIASFGEDQSGEILAVAPWPGYLYRFERRDEPGGEVPGSFPTLLSETGIFSDVEQLEVEPGVIPYEVTNSLWSDNALKRRWVALPGSDQVSFRAKDAWLFPIGTATIKHFELERSDGSLRRLETRIMLRQETQWVGLTYRWNEEQTDAELLPDTLDEVIDLGDRDQTWHYPGRSECLGCHTTAAGRVLGARTRQLGFPLSTPGPNGSQLNDWICRDLFDTEVEDPDSYDRYASLYDSSADRDLRVRSHLAVNCATCHQPGAPAPGDLDFRFDPPADDLNLIDVIPSEDDLGVVDARRIVVGDKESSLVWLRMASEDVEVRMARGTLLPDPEAVFLVGEWIDADLFEPDGDEDGIPDEEDLCPSVYDPDQRDSDFDGIGDACDPDYLPDVSVLSMVVPSEANRGDPVLLEADVANDGFGLSSFPVTFHLSADRVLDTGIDSQIGSCWIEDLAGGVQASCSSVDATIPESLPQVGTQGRGPFYWIACADSIGGLEELDETNNCLIRDETFRIPEPTGVVLGLTAILALGLLRRVKRREPI